MSTVDVAPTGWGHDHIWSGPVRRRRREDVRGFVGPSCLAQDAARRAVARGEGARPRPPSAAHRPGSTRAARYACLPREGLRLWGGGTAANRGGVEERAPARW